MPSPIRIDIPGVVYEVTIRCVQSRFLLLPEAELNELIYGALGRGLEMFPNVHLHDFVVESNHMHRLESSTDGESRSGFDQYVNQRISFEASRRYGWEGGIFRRAGRPIPLVTHEDQLHRFRYLRAHGVKENLVARADDRPGPSALPFLRYGTVLQGTFIWHDALNKAQRSAKGRQFDPSAFQERYEVPITKLPALEHLGWKEIHQYTDDLTRAIEAEYDASRTAPVLGRKGILAQHPHARPKNSKKGPAPVVHCLDKTMRQRFRKLARYLTDALRAANQKLRAGEKDVAFPPFCHPARLPYVSWEASMAGTIISFAETAAISGQVAFSGGEPAASGRQVASKANAPPSLVELLQHDAPFLLV